MISLLVFSGHDEANERAMIEQFVFPTVAPTAKDNDGVSRRGSAPTLQASLLPLQRSMSSAT